MIDLVKDKHSTQLDVRITMDHSTIHLNLLISDLIRSEYHQFRLNRFVSCQLILLNSCLRPGNISSVYFDHLIKIDSKFLMSLAYLI